MRDALATLVLLTFEKLQEVRVGAHPLGHGPRQLIVRHPLRQFHGEAWIIRCALVHECHLDSVVQILEVVDAGRQVWEFFSFFLFEEDYVAVHQLVQHLAENAPSEYDLKPTRVLLWLVSAHNFGIADFDIDLEFEKNLL